MNKLTAVARRCQQQQQLLLCCGPECVFRARLVLDDDDELDVDGGAAWPEEPHLEAL